MFKNAARRPYSIHPNGVSYTKQTEGLSYEDGSKYWFKYDNEVKPGTTYTYIWTIPVEVGPKPEESQCRTWVYYSGVNPVSSLRCKFFFNLESRNSLKLVYIHERNECACVFSLIAIHIIIHTKIGVKMLAYLQLSTALQQMV